MVIISLGMVAVKEAAEQWASSLHVYVAYMLGETSTFSAVGGGGGGSPRLIREGDSCEVVQFQ